MFTLQEFIFFTKAWEYIIAIASVLVFIGLWTLLNNTSSPEQEHPGKEDAA